MDVAVVGWRKTTSDLAGQVGNETLERKCRFICFVKPDGEFTKIDVLILSEAVPLCKIENLTACSSFSEPSCTAARPHEIRLPGAPILRGAKGTNAELVAQKLTI